MIANGNARRIEQRVQDFLDETLDGKRFSLHVRDDLTREEDEWVYIVVVPDKPGIRAVDFVQVLTDVELQVRQAEQKKEILLVPASN